MSGLLDLRSFLSHVWCALNSTKILKCQGLSIKCWEWKNAILDSLVPRQVFRVHSLVSTVPHSWLNGRCDSCKCASKIQRHRMPKPVLELYFMILYDFLDFSSMSTRLICLKSGDFSSKVQERCHALVAFRPSPLLFLCPLYIISYTDIYTYIIFNAIFLYYFEYFFLNESQQPFKWTIWIVTFLKLDHSFTILCYRRVCWTK